MSPPRLIRIFPPACINTNSAYRLSKLAGCTPERREMKSLEIAGVSVHIGSQITDVKPFAATMERVAELTRALRADGHTIKYVDAGGGLGIAYEDHDLPGFAEQVASYADALLRPLRRLEGASPARTWPLHRWTGRGAAHALALQEDQRQQRSFWWWMRP